MTAPCPALGFHVLMERAPAESSASDELLRSWRSFLDDRGLRCDGGGGREGMTFVVASEASQATENDRVATRRWLAARPELASWQVGDLEDLNQNDR